MKIKLVIVVATFLTATSCGKISKPETPAEIPPVEVKVQVVDSMRSGVMRTYVGEVEENASIAMSFATGGTLQQLLVAEGQKVKKGELLACIDRQNAQNAYNAAQATLHQAEDGYNRLKQVYEQGSVAEVKWVEVQTQRDQARSMAAIARKQLADCEMRAPYDGVIGSCNVKAGANLLPGQSVLTLLDVKRIHISFTVPENEISAISVGRAGTIEVPALNNETFIGEITDRGLTANRIAHSYRVKIALPNAEQKFLPGMVCKVYLEQPSKSGFIIPGNAVQTRPEGLSVWCVNQGIAERRRVESGQFAANGILITNGLQQGDTLIVAGFQKLYEGAKIVIKEE